MSVEVFQEPSDSSVHAKASSSTLGISDLPLFLSVQDVRITPGHMLFENAYEGKTYRQKLVIQNCGRNLAMVKLFRPNSSTFEYVPFAQGICLSSGMKVVRTIKYTYRTAIGTLEGLAPIWINDEEGNSNANFSTLTKAVIGIEPEVIDFGKMDAVNRTSTRILTIRNDGYRATKFAIDLGRNTLDLNVHPIKGIVYAKSSVRVIVEIVGTEGGDFIDEFWIKVHPPMRVVVQGTFIAPKLLVRKLIAGLDFIFVEFPVTYYGSSNVEMVLVKNYSSFDTMFCVMAETNHNIMTLEEAKKVCTCYQNFHVVPRDGRIEANKGSLLQITFTPAKTEPHDRVYATCFFKVVRMDCQDVQNDQIYEDSYIPNYDSIEEPITSSTNIDHEDIVHSLQNITFQDIISTESFSFEHSIKVCVYGEKEDADVELRPDAFDLSDLMLDRNYERTLLVKNKSTKLPIQVKYNKVGSVYVKPAEFELEPSESLETLVVVRPSSLGTTTKEITFDLLTSYKSLNEHITKKVGSASLKIHLETVEVIKTIRTKHCVDCTDLSGRLAPQFPFRLTEEELAKKLENNKYYLNYIRRLKNHAPIKNVLKEYQISNTKLYLRQDVKCFKLNPKRKAIIPETPFYPLAPRLLYNIKITPKSILLRNIAAHSTVADSFEINNLNTFPIRVFAKASKSNLVFEGTGRYIIQAHEKKKILFLITTGAVGRYYVNISVLINDSTMYEVTAVASVVSKVLTLDQDYLVFKETSRDYKLIKLINPFSCFVSFSWDVSPGNFNIYPPEGIIRPERSILCKVTIDPNPAEPVATEFLLQSEGGQSKAVTVVYMKEHPSVVVHPYNNDFGIMPLNMPRTKKIIIRNLKNLKMYYRILNPFPLPGIAIEPEYGIVAPLDTNVLIAHALLKSVIEFNTQIYILIDEELELKIPLHGIVEYPHISFSPDSLHFRKIAPYSFDTHAFKVKNLSECECLLTFPCHELPEFTITESESEQYPHKENLRLERKETKLLYMHYHPQYTSTYSLFLSYVINDILGPARSFVRGGESTMYFLRECTSLYEHTTNVKIKQFPSSMKTVRVYSTAVEARIELSNVEIEFKYFGEGHCNNVTSKDFVITNTSEETTAVCIRTDVLQDSCFSLVPRDEKNLEYYNEAYKIIIEPGEKAIFEASFHPDSLGEYMIRIPIFLRKYYNNKIFNFLTVKGVYHTPFIVSSENCLNFEPVPIKITNKISLTLELKNHSKNCKLSLCEEFSFIYLEFQQTKETPFVDVDVIYLGDVTKCLDMSIIFKCTCGSTCSVPVTGVIENCLLTSHVYLTFLLKEFTANAKTFNDFLSPEVTPWWATFQRPNVRSWSPNLNETCYPLFPADHDSSSYAIYMRNIKKTLEMWVFTQGFYGKRYYSIPEGFSDFCRIRSEKQILSSFKKPPPIDLPLLILVVNFTGTAIKEKLGICPENDDELAWFVYTHKTNSEILHYLRSFPVFIPHVKSKFLLNYDQYLIYQKIKHPNEAPLEEPIFYGLSTQNWIDLILQMIKAFVLFRSVPEIVEERLQASFSYMSAAEGNEEIFDTGVYGTREKFLLKWLQTIYDKEKDKIWQAPGKDIEITFFDEDLRDGLVLGAVTAHFCPYLKTEVQDMYSDPQNPEEFHHNACILVQIWDMLHLSYVIKPCQILTGTIVEMLLLVTYLYNVLPDLQPKEKIMIEAKLTRKSSTCIVLENKGEHSIHYKIVFFNNKNNMFYVGKDYAKVAANSDKTIRVYFHAKSIETKTVTLLFSGETSGHKYGKSIVISLEGIPDVFYACTEIPVTVDLYKNCHVRRVIESPFKKKTDYTILFGFHSVDSHQNFVYNYEHVRRFRKICKLLLDHDMCSFDKNGQWEISFTTCVKQVGPRYVWLYFTNPEVGDWGAKVILTGRVTESCFENINVTIPDNYKNLVCKCKRRGPIDISCPRTLHVMFPKTNYPLWNARKTMILNQISGGEHVFWSRRLFSLTGTRVLRLIMAEEEDHPLKECLDENVDYIIDDDELCPIVTVSKVTVTDVISDGLFTLPIHPKKNKSLLGVKQCQLQLTSENNTEARFYTLHFNGS